MLILKDIIEKELPYFNLSRKEKRVLRKRREGKRLLEIGKEEKPPLTLERIRQIVVMAEQKEKKREEALERIVRKINRYLKQKNV